MTKRRTSAASWRRTLALDYPPDKLEIVVSDGSTDKTDEIVGSFPDPRVRLVRVTDRKGKTNAQNIGVTHCNGDVIVFSDATTVYHPESLRYLAANFVEPKVGAVSGRYKYFHPLRCFFNWLRFYRLLEL